MKRLSFLFILFCCVYANGQTYDSVDFRKLRIDGFYMGSKKAELEKKFGAPHKVVTTEGGKGIDMYSDYYYGKSTLRVSPAGVFNGFKLTDDQYILGCNQRLIKVGASLKEFAIYFPASFQSYSKDAGGKFRLKIRPGNAYIVFKTKDGIVTEIETWEPTL